MENFTLEQIVTVSVLCIWFAFPMGMLISVMRQSNEQSYPKISEAPEKKHHYKHHHPKVFIINNVGEDGELHHDEVPEVPAYQIPKKEPRPSHWRT